MAAGVLWGDCCGSAAVGEGGVKLGGDVENDTRHLTSDGDLCGFTGRHSILTLGGREGCGIPGDSIGEGVCI